MTALDDFLRQKSVAGSITLADELEAAGHLALSLVEVEEQALVLGIMPKRSLRNGLSCPQQLRLLHARVAIIGCGGLGGSVAMLLARLGVGSLHLVDPDIFEEHNLNRQQFATLASLGRPKVEAARKALAAINPVIRVTSRQATLSEADVLTAEIVVDGLDSAADRLRLAAICRQHNRPLVHGAVREWYGQVGIVTPDNDLFANLYPSTGHPPATEPAPQVLAPTVAVIAGIQAAETGKLLLGLPSPLAGHWLSCSLLDCDFEAIPSLPRP